MKAVVKQPVREQLAAVVTKILFGWIYAFGLSQLVLRLNRLPIEPARQAFVILGALVLLAVLTWGRYQLLALSGLTALSGLLLWLIRRQWLPDDGLAGLFAPLSRQGTWAIDYLTGSVPGRASELGVLALVICILLAALAYLILVRFNSPMTAALVLVIVLFLARDMNRIIVYGWSFPAGIAFFAALARHQHRTYRSRRQDRHFLAARLMVQSLPAGIAVLALALVLTSIIPASFFHSRAFEGLIDDLAGQISGIQWEISEFPDYSLQQAGFYPLENRLGGPVILSDQPLLRISGSDESLLLRGSVSQIYDGQRWLQDPDRTFYRLDSPLWKSEQDDIYDLSRPDLYSAGLTAAQFNRTVNLNWSPIGLPTRTLFTAGKPLLVTLAQQDPFQAYFRPSGQLFSKHWIQPEQSIVMTSRVLRTDSSQFADMVRSIQEKLDPDEKMIPASVLDRYLQLPGLPEYRSDSLLYRLVQDLTAAVDTPYDQVLAMRQYLMTSNTYNLTVSVPPEGVDFVTWFLQTREGYCVYFATAMTMLSRLAGIPARYVEGYYAPPPASPGESRILTGREGHAWTEVYLAGIGWITVDATPGTGRVQPDPSPDVTPGVTPGVSVSPSATLTPTPDPIITVRPSPGTGPDDQQNPLDRITTGILWWLLILPFLLAGTILLAWKRLKRRHDPVFIRHHLQNPQHALLFYWSEIKFLLHQLSKDRRAGQTPSQFLLEQTGPDGWLAGREELVQAAALSLDQSLYGSEPPKPEDLAGLARLYDLLEETVRQNRGLWTWLLRLLRCGDLPSDDGQGDGFVIS